LDASAVSEELPSGNEDVLEEGGSAWYQRYIGGTSGGAGGRCFLNALVARRKFMNASTPSLVPRMSDVTRSSEAFLE